MKATSMMINSNRVIVPKALNTGDTIGIIAPAGPFDKSRFDEGIAVIHEMGFATKVGEDIYKRNGYLAGDDAHRAAQFNAMVADDEVQAVMCARGGYGVLRILDQLDYTLLSNHPKPLVGFSDITALHRAIQLRTGLITFHGPMVTTIAQSNTATQCAWRDTLKGHCDFSQMLPQLRILREGAAEGALAGGNLATLCHLVGTPYGADYSDTILLLEDVGEAPYRIDRMLTQMIMAGVLDGISGLIVGTFENCGAVDEIDALVMERFQDFDIPVLSGMPVGHGKDNMTVPLGGNIRLDTQGSEMMLLGTVFQNRDYKSW
jgi:muramoyltetrapeptide carboxypeptidase